MNARLLACYVGLLLAAIAAFVFVSELGNLVVAPAPEPGAPTFGGAAGEAADKPLPHVLLALVVVILAARATGALFRLFGQPPVIGEMLAGILLGPSAFGLLAPAASAFLFPASISPMLNIIAQVGVVLFLFLVGLELDTAVLKKRTQASVAVSHASIVVPFVLGGALALLLYPRLSSNDVPFLAFALFVGVSMSVTAFPVLARILTDTGLMKSPLGIVALACAAVDDVTAWCLLALVVGIAKANTDTAIVTMALAVVFTAAMLLLVRPRLARWARGFATDQSVTAGAIAFVFVGLLLSALATESIGIHALFGSFLFGALIPHDSPLARVVVGKLTDVVVVLFLPLFFAFTGLRTQVGLVSGFENWLLCALVIAVAIAGKFGGSYAAARFTGLPVRESLALGALMNTRGLMELVVLNIGLDLKIISPTLFAMMVLMALVTTTLTTPLLYVLGLASWRSAPKAEPAQ
ncbi:MAG TPA: cation:proton antiporter [Planctomycetota bacterium]|nr:cation:proton antiporter [Planctomycetota bacterium]